MIIDDDGYEYDSYEDFLADEQEREQLAIEAGTWECPCGFEHPPGPCEYQ